MRMDAETRRRQLVAGIAAIAIQGRAPDEFFALHKVLFGEVHNEPCVARDELFHGGSCAEDMAASAAPLLFHTGEQVLIQPIEIAQDAVG